MRKLIFLGLVLVLLVACGSNELGINSETTEDSSVMESLVSETEEPAESQTTMGRMGQGGGMMARHHAEIPAAYGSVVNPAPQAEESVARGAEIYAAHCAVCHGDGGMGDGVAAKGFDPVPAAVAHTSQMLGDDYMFWRISEGGATEPFSSSMPAWENVLEEEARWDVINYVRALGAGSAMPRQGMGGRRYDPEGELQMRTEMLATAVAENVISQTEADTFNKVHTAMDKVTPKGQMRGNMNMRENMMLNQLLEAGQISQMELDDFVRIHDLLVEAELMQ